MNLLKKLFLGLTLSWATVASVSAQTNKTKEIDSLMQAVHKLGIFNGNVLVAQKGKIIYQSEFGYSDGSKKTKLTAKYRFNIGSIAKEFNAVGIMMLQERGKLNLNDKVSKFIPSLPQWADKISIKNLLQYTSGVPDLRWKTIKNDGDIMNDLKALKELDFEPGTKYAYNNSNVFLQRRIIEKVSGMPFDKFVGINMLKPCGMNESIVDPALNDKNIAVSFNNDLVNDPWFMPMSGWVSVTSQDLLKWNNCLHAGKLITNSSIIQILQPYQPGNQAGLGNGLVENGTIKEHSHHGSSYNFESLMYTNLTADISIILNTNNKNMQLFGIKDAIKSILNGSPYQIPKKSIFAVFVKKMDMMSADELITAYNGLKQTNANDYNFKDEGELNQIGYQFLNKGRADDAIKIFTLNVQNFPASSNLYDSLAEGYYKQGNKEQSVINYKKSYELDNKNTNALEMIKKITGGQ